MGGWVDGWVDDSFRKYCHFVAPSCKLELAIFSAVLIIQDGTECGNILLLLQVLLVFLYNQWQEFPNLIMDIKKKVLQTKWTDVKE